MERRDVYHEMIMTVALLATTANGGKSFHIGPWIIVPILILVAIIGTAIYVVRDRRKRRSGDKHR
jgi:uncharacterized membrane protein (DUF485 family)